METNKTLLSQVSLFALDFPRVSLFGAYVFYAMLFLVRFD